MEDSPILFMLNETQGSQFSSKISVFYDKKNTLLKT